METSADPIYASNKYKTTVRLLEKARVLRNLVDNGEISLGPLEGRRFDRSYQSLELKAEVLGYLEDLTQGGVHKEQLSSDSLRRFTDWVMSKTPRVAFPSEEHPEAYLRMIKLRSFILNAQDPEKAKREMLRTLYMESRPAINLSKVENLVLAGGGAKALSLAGVVKSLEEKGFSSQLKRVAGTSGGAIIAMAFAAGYDAKEMRNIVMDNQFGLFTLGSRADNFIMRAWAHHFNRKDPTSKMHVLSDNSLAHNYHSAMMQALGETLKDTDDPKLNNFQKGLSGYEGKGLARRMEKLLKMQPNKDVIFPSIVDRMDTETQMSIAERAKVLTLEKMNDDELLGSITLYKTPKAAIVSAMRHRTGQDMVRGFFSDLVYEKLRTFPKPALRAALYGKEFKNDSGKVIKQDDVRNITFAQWQTLHEMMPETVKELHISMSVLKPLGDRVTIKDRYDPYEHADAAYDNPEFSDLPVVDAVRVSMNLPPIYRRYSFTVNGNKYKGSDGGIKSNMSLGTFDNKYPPERTIGVFYKTSSEIEAARDVDRMLVIPRSLKELDREITFIEAKDAEAQRVLKATRGAQKTMPADATPQQHETLERELNRLTDFRRQFAGELEGLKREREHLISSGTGTLQKWITHPMDEVGHLFNRYLNRKSNDDLRRSHNLRRLAMVNTHEINTGHFKMPDVEKSMQLSYGEDAMNSLLNGTYCLENHYYLHPFNSIGNPLLGHNLNMEFEEAFMKEAEPVFDSIEQMPEHIGFPLDDETMPGDVDTTRVRKPL